MEPNPPMPSPAEMFHIEAMHRLQQEAAWEAQRIAEAEERRRAQERAAWWDSLSDGERKAHQRKIEVAERQKREQAAREREALMRRERAVQEQRRLERERHDQAVYAREKGRGAELRKEITDLRAKIRAVPNREGWIGGLGSVIGLGFVWTFACLCVLEVLHAAVGFETTPGVGMPVILVLYLAFIAWIAGRKMSADQERARLTNALKQTVAKTGCGRSSCADCSTEQASLLSRLDLGTADA